MDDIEIYYKGINFNSAGNGVVMQDTESRVFSTMEWLHNFNSHRAVTVTVEGTSDSSGISLTAGNWNSVAATAIMTVTVLRDVIISSMYEASPVAYKYWRVKRKANTVGQGLLVGWWKIVERSSPAQALGVYEENRGNIRGYVFSFGVGSCVLSCLHCFWIWGWGW